jgi:hypothetical protein
VRGRAALAAGARPANRPLPAGCCRRGARGTGLPSNPGWPLHAPLQRLQGEPLLHFARLKPPPPVAGPRPLAAGHEPPRKGDRWGPARPLTATATRLATGHADPTIQNARDHLWPRRAWACALWAPTCLPMHPSLFQAQKPGHSGPARLPQTIPCSPPACPHATRPLHWGRLT